MIYNGIICKSDNSTLDVENIPIITLYAMIVNKKKFAMLDDSVLYMSQSIKSHFNLQISANEPVITLQVVDESLNIKFKKVMSLKSCFNLNDGSTLQIIKKSGQTLYPNNPSLKDKEFIVKILCKKNPELEGNSFAQQRYNSKTVFYKIPSIWASKPEIQTLIDECIIKKTGSFKTYERTEGQTLFTTEKICIFGHGENGCDSDQKLRQIMIKDKIPNNKNRFNQIMSRQIKGSF